MSSKMNYKKLKFSHTRYRADPGVQAASPQVIPQKVTRRGDEERDLLIIKSTQKRIFSRMRTAKMAKSIQ